MQRKVYPSDVAREQFDRTRPRIIDQYDVFCALLYLLKSGCKWRMLPFDFPKWRTVHHYFSLWSRKKNKNTPKEVLKKLVSKEHLRNGRACNTSLVIVDAQSVKNTSPQKTKDMMQERKYQASNGI